MSANHFADKDPAYELGARRMQVHLLREALRRFAVHRDYCATVDGKACTCGLVDAFGIGPDAEVVCGLPEAPRVTVCAWCPDAAERTNSARAHGKDIRYNDCEFHRG